MIDWIKFIALRVAIAIVGGGIAWLWVLARVPYERMVDLQLHRRGIDWFASVGPVYQASEATV